MSLTTSAPEKVRLLLAWMVMQLVDSPQSVQVEMAQDDRGHALRIIVADRDRGQVIGKQGRTARSLRTIVKAIGATHGTAFTVDICESRAPGQHETESCQAETR